MNEEQCVDRKVINMISHVSREERDAILKMLDVNRAEPQMKLILAIFRDVYMFKEMTQAMLLRYQSKIKELEARIEEQK
jgi:hypothetical protein